MVIVSWVLRAVSVALALSLYLRGLPARQFKVFCEVSENCFPWPGESIWKAVEYQPAGHLASLQLWNFPPHSIT